MAILRVLIVEDSELVSDILTEALQSDSQVRVVGVARNGAEALTLVPKLNPNLITMDVWMPVLDGFATVERIMADNPTPILVITSSSLKSDVQLSLRMLAAGALDVIEKPSFHDEKQWERICAELLAKVHLLAEIKVVTHLRGRHPQSNSAASKSAPGNFIVRDEDKLTKPLPAAALPRPTPNSAIPRTPANQQPLETIASFPAVPFYQVIAIASSTGGPTALLKILQMLPSNFPASILVVQHISQGFTQGLVEWLQREVKLKVRIAANDTKLMPGTIFVAPDQHNLAVKASPLRQLELNDRGEDFLRPNADILLQSVAQVFGERAIGIILTGMGNDGAKGLKEMARQGAYTIAQDEATSLIYGMPKAAIEIEAVRQVLPLGQIAGTLVKLLQRPA